MVSVLLPFLRPHVPRVQRTTTDSLALGSCMGDGILVLLYPAIACTASFDRDSRCCRRVGFGGFGEEIEKKALGCRRGKLSEVS